MMRYDLKQSKQTTTCSGKPKGKALNVVGRLAEVLGEGCNLPLAIL